MKAHQTTIAGRRASLRAIALGMLGAAFEVRAQGAGTRPRIGVLLPGANPREAAFWQAMKQLGYVDGKTIVVDRRSADGDMARLPVIAADLVKTRPDVIVAITSAAAVAAKQATSTIPIVFAGSADPVAAGLVANLGRPGGNLTGTSSQSAVAIPKLLELVRQIVPSATRIAALWDPVNSFSQQVRIGETYLAAARLQFLVRAIEVKVPEDLDSAFAKVGTERTDAVLVASDTFFIANAQRLVALAHARRMPVFSTARTLVDAGILASHGPELSFVAGRAATYVQRILKGAKPGELPVELPSKFETVISLGTAKIIGLEVPRAVLARADHVLQ
jgi:putative ABC transport system substrate-binding protein